MMNMKFVLRFIRSWGFDTMEKIAFTKEQKEYLRFNLRWLNNARLDEWIDRLIEE